MPNVSINLIEPGTLYGDRINQLDFRVAKILRFGWTRSTVVAGSLQRGERQRGADLQPQTFVPNGPWLQANSVLTGRLARISAEFTW